MIECHEESLCYQQKLVAFIDILGFSQAVKSLDANQQLAKFAKVFEWLKIIKNFKHDSDGGADFRSGLNVTTFSDNILISCESRKVHSLIWACGYLQAKLLSEGCAVRGGIAQGNIYHQNGMVFGGGLICAYELESKEAENPRIILQQDVRDLMLPLVASHMLLQEPDEFYHINPFLFVGDPGGDGALARVDDELKAEHLLKIQSVLKEKCQSNMDQKDKSKWQWLAGQYCSLVGAVDRNKLLTSDFVLNIN